MSSRPCGRLGKVVRQRHHARDDIHALVRRFVALALAQEHEARTGVRPSGAIVSRDWPSSVGAVVTEVRFGPARLRVADEHMGPMMLAVEMADPARFACSHKRSLTGAILTSGSGGSRLRAQRGTGRMSGRRDPPDPT